MSLYPDFPNFQNHSTPNSICPSPEISPNFKIVQPLIQYGLLPRSPQISQDFKNIRPLREPFIYVLAEFVR